MIRINPCSEDVETFQYERINHLYPRVQIRTDVLWLKTDESPHKRIAVIAGVSKNTVPRYLCMYNEGSVDKSREVNFYKPQSDLAQHTSTIEACVKDHPPATIKVAMSIVEKLTGLKRSETQVRKSLKSIGLKRLKACRMPSKADSDEQERFIDEESEPRLKETESGERKVFL
ncbi:winged helix-turn-helix domain-containing protein [Desulfococcaceae bacterium HSG7]|nr:winged helix-turn-helix domain-containing protein [Desulfococcaceae bacterium HSG7]